jgi:hypothetical protein
MLINAGGLYAKPIDNGSLQQMQLCVTVTDQRLTS